MFFTIGSEDNMFFRQGKKKRNIFLLPFLIFRSSVYLFHPFPKSLSSFPEEVQRGQCTYHKERSYVSSQLHFLIFFLFSICIKLTILMFLDMKVTIAEIAL